MLATILFVFCSLNSQVLEVKKLSNVELVKLFSGNNQLKKDAAMKELTYR